MRKYGFQGSKNPFIGPMEQSLTNALNIVVYHRQRCSAHSGDGTWQMAMFNDFKTPADNFIAKISAKTGDLAAQVVLTDMFESVFKDMAIKLDAADDLVIPVHGTNTPEHRIIWGPNRNRFYDGSYEERKAALTSLAAEMNTQGCTDAATYITDYITAITDARNAQANRIIKVGDDGTSIETLLNTLIKKLNKNLGVLKSNFGDDDDCEEKVNKFYPLNLLGDRTKGHYQLLVPKGEFRKVAIHTFKTGETIEIINQGDADVWLSMADNADNPVSAGYVALANSSQTKEPSVLGDLTKKYIIATNNNLTTSTDIIFNIKK